MKLRKTVIVISIVLFSLTTLYIVTDNQKWTYQDGKKVHYYVDSYIKDIMDDIRRFKYIKRDYNKKVYECNTISYLINDKDCVKKSKNHYDSRVSYSTNTLIKDIMFVIMLLLSSVFLPILFGNFYSWIQKEY